MMIEERERSAVITTVYPVVNGNGANYVALNLAYAVRAQDQYSQIAVVDFDFENPYLGVGLHGDTTHGIDNLIDKLNGRFLDNQLFKENMIELKENIHLLQGTKMGRFKNLVRQEHIEQILEFLRKNYEYVFITTNASPSDGGTPVSLFNADNLLVVGRHTNKNEILAEKASRTIENYSKAKNMGLIYNLYSGTNDRDFSTYFSHLQVFGTIPYLPDTVDGDNLVGRGLQILRRNKRDDASTATYANIMAAFGLEKGR